jgi:hypothetical protein
MKNETGHRDIDKGLSKRREGKAGNRTERLLVKTINSDKVTVNLRAEHSDVIGYDSDGGKITSESGGSFMGNTVTFDQNGNATHVNTEQFFSSNKAKGFYSEGAIGYIISHEITEYS